MNLTKNIYFSVALDLMACSVMAFLVFYIFSLSGDTFDSLIENFRIYQNCESKIAPNEAIESVIISKKTNGNFLNIIIISSFMFGIFTSNLAGKLYKLVKQKMA